MPQLDADHPVENARKMAEAMKAAGASNYQYTELAKHPHSVAGEVYPDEKVRTWLFEQSK